MITNPAPGTVWQRLQTLRVDLMDKGIAKSGKNTHLGFTYFELSDFLPDAMRLCQQYQLLGLFSFTRETATLDIIDSLDATASVRFSMPVTPSLFGKERSITMTTTGADQTYLRRYLWRQALELVESDVFDSPAGTIARELSALLDAGELELAARRFTERLASDKKLRADVWNLLDPYQRADINRHFIKPTVTEEPHGNRE